MRCDATATVTAIECDARKGDEMTRTSSCNAQETEAGGFVGVDMDMDMNYNELFDLILFSYHLSTLQFFLSSFFFFIFIFFFIFLLLLWRESRGGRR